MNRDPKAVIENFPGLRYLAPQLYHIILITSLRALILTGHEKFLFQGWLKRIPILGSTSSLKLIGASSIKISNG